MKALLALSLCLAAAPARAEEDALRIGTVEFSMPKAGEEAKDADGTPIGTCTFSPPCHPEPGSACKQSAMGIAGLTSEEACYAECKKQGIDRKHPSEANGRCSWHPSPDAGLKTGNASCAFEHPDGPGMGKVDGWSDPKVDAESCETFCEQRGGRNIVGAHCTFTPLAGKTQKFY